MNRLRACVTACTIALALAWVAGSPHPTHYPCKRKAWVEARVAGLHENAPVESISAKMCVVQVDGLQARVYDPVTKNEYNVTAQNFYSSKPPEKSERLSMADSQLGQLREILKPGEPEQCRTPAAAITLAADNLAERIFRTPGSPTPGPAEPAEHTVPPEPATQPPLTTQNLQTLAAASQIAVDQSQREFVDSAVELMAANTRDADSDHREVSKPYTRLPLPILRDRFRQARQSLLNAADDLQQGTGELEFSDRMRFRNLYLNAGDKAALGMAAIDQELNRGRTLGSNSPFSGLLGPNEAANPLARSAALSEIFDTALAKDEKATTNDALTDRILMFNGLPASKQKQLARKLRLFEPTTLKLPTGETRTLNILHNGYIFGGMSSGTDCSQFVSAALPSEVRKSRFNTLDFKRMYDYLRTRKLKRPPLYKKERESLIIKTAEAFSPVDPYLGQELQTGDLLIYRLAWDPSGHVFLVRSYNRETLEARVLESSQSAGTIRERSFPLSLDPLTKPVRHFRPGLHVLRLKPARSNACHYGTQSRKPASNPPGDVTPGAAL